MKVNSNELSVSALVTLQESDQSYLLLDIRESDEVMFCTFPNSLHIRMHQIPSQWHTLPKDQLIVVFCHYGTRSRRVVAFLQQQGMTNVTNLTGGIDLWAIEVEPEMGRY